MQPNGFAPFADAGSEREPSPGEETELAERGERLSARVVDDLIAIGAATPGLFIAFVTVLRGTPSGEDPLPPHVIEGILFGFVAFVGVTIYQWYLIATRGQTIGKRMLKLRVVKTDGRAVGFVDGVILREWVITAVTSLPFIGFVAALADGLMIFGAERRCLHDLIATTKVVRARA
jgi:uncharacterized RDD family membrane protein YckC